MASLLDPVQVAQIVPDPHERAHLTHLGPVRPSHGASGAPGTPAAQITARIMTAEDPDEIGWLRAELWQTVTEAREHRPVPRPGPEPPTPTTSMTPTTPTASTDPTTPAGPSAVRPTTAREKPRGLLGWLRREKT
jgi:hypothetical protein